MRYDAGRRQRTRERVLDAAVIAIRESGPEKVGVADVMTRAGLTHGAFYGHFRSRDALLEAAIGRMLDGAEAMFAKRTDGLTPGEGLKAYIAYYLSTAHRDAWATSCPLPLLASDLPRLQDGPRLAFARGVERLCGAFAQALASLGCNDPQTIAVSAVSQMVGAVCLARAMGPTLASDTLLAQAHLALIGRLAL